MRSYRNSQSISKKREFSPSYSPVGQAPCSQALHQTSEEEAEEEKEKILLGLVEKALRREVGVEEMHSLRGNLPPLQVGEEVAAAALWGRRRIQASLDHFLLFASTNARSGLEGIGASSSLVPRGTQHPSRTTELHRLAFTFSNAICHHTSFPQ